MRRKQKRMKRKPRRKKTNASSVRVIRINKYWDGIQLIQYFLAALCVFFVIRPCPYNLHTLRADERVIGLWSLRVGRIPAIRQAVDPPTPTPEAIPATRRVITPVGRDREHLKVPYPSAANNTQYGPCSHHTVISPRLNDIFVLAGKHLPGTGCKTAGKCINCIIT